MIIIQIWYDEEHKIEKKLKHKLKSINMESFLFGLQIIWAFNIIIHYSYYPYFICFLCVVDHIRLYVAGMFINNENASRNI